MVSSRRSIISILLLTDLSPPEKPNTEPDATWKEFWNIRLVSSAELKSFLTGYESSYMNSGRSVPRKKPRKSPKNPQNFTNT